MYIFIPIMTRIAVPKGTVLPTPRLTTRNSSLCQRPRGDDAPAGGEVTSAVVWCWMAAIMRRTRDPENPYSFVCSGTLVERDLVVTTASCASR